VLHSEVLSNRGSIATVCSQTPGNVSISCGSTPGDYAIEGVQPFPFLGQVLAKVGQKTGYSAGAVVATCEDINVSNSNVTLFCQDRVAALSAHGDSGSPVFTSMIGSAPYGVGFNGILWGGTADGSMFGFSPHWAIEAELGTGFGSLNVLHQFDAPAIQILQPSDGSTVAYNSFPTKLTAKVTDPDGHCPASCSVAWHSDKDGDIGTGLTIDYLFLGAGPRTITAKVTKFNGMNSSTSIHVSTSNTVPQVWINKPTAGQALQKGAAYVFEGHSFDQELFGPLPCSALKWKSSMSSDPSPTGCAPKVTFATTGFRTLTLMGTDAGGLTAKDTVLIVVVNAPLSSPPVVAIVDPVANAMLDPDKYVILKGTATDPDMNGLNGSLTYQWLIKDGSTETQLGSGTLVNAGQTSMLWKPADTIGFSCGGSWVKLYLYVTDPDGATAFDVRDVKVAYPTC
jgi:hypothetical protein